MPFGMEGRALSATSSSAAEAAYTLTPPATSACVPLRNNLRRLSFSAIAAPHLLLNRSVTRKVVGGCRIGTTFRRTREVLRPRFLPLGHGEPRGVVENATSTNRDPRDDLDIGVHLRVAAVDVAEFPMKLLKHGHISFLANRKSAELRSVDLPRWIHCGAANEVVQGNTHGTEFGQYVGHADGPVVAGVEVRGH